MKWEVVEMTNIGVDLGFLKNSLNVTLEYFDKTNNGMIGTKELPQMNGTATMGKDKLGNYYDIETTLPYVNLGGVNNKGFEISVDYKKNMGDLIGSFRLDFGMVRNKVLDMPADSIQRGGVHQISPICLTRIGYSISDFWGRKTDGIFKETDPKVYSTTAKKYVFSNQDILVSSSGDTTYSQPNAQAGDFRFRDINHDGKINDADKVILGSPLPKFTLGFSFNLEYKIVDLNANFYCSYGNKIFNGLKQYLYCYQENTNRCAAFADRYKSEVIKDGMVVGKSQ